MIEDGQVPFQDLLELVRQQERIWVRVGAALVGNSWTGLAYDLVAPVEPPGWEERVWQYPEAVFCAVTATGPEAAEWLETGGLTICEKEVVLPGLPREEPNRHLQVHGLASLQKWSSYEPLPWPATFYELTGQRQQLPQKMLVGLASPSFMGFREAAVAFFGLSSNMPMSGLPGPSVRLQDLTGRIARVPVHPTHVEVHLEGLRLLGLIVELTGSVPRLQQEQLSVGNETQEVRFDIPDGLPEQSWVVLKSGSNCVDRKFINWPFSLTHDAGVEIVQEPVVTLQVLVAGGEGPTTEFKREVPTDREGRRKVCRTLAAFANGIGGHVLFGVEDDHGQIVGVPAEQATADAKDTLTRWITYLVVPHVDFHLQVLQTEDSKQVLDVEIKKGVLPPYGVEPANPQYYIRRGATTFPASAEDVRHMARSTPPVDQGMGWSQAM